MFHDDSLGTSFMREMYSREQKSADLPPFTGELATSNPNPTTARLAQEKQALDKLRQGAGIESKVSGESATLQLTVPSARLSTRDSAGWSASPSSPTANLSARDSARQSAEPSGRQAKAKHSARLGSGRLDTIRSDMSTARLESTLAALTAEKMTLMNRLKTVEEELILSEKQSCKPQRRTR